MADALRRPIEDEEAGVPNLDVYPPAAPLGSADPTMTAGSTQREVIDRMVAARAEGTNEANQLEITRNGAYARAGRGVGSFLGSAVNKVNRGLHVVRSRASDSDLRDRAEDVAEDLKERAADLANGVSDRASEFSDTARRRFSALSSDARLRADELRRQVMCRTRNVRARGELFIDERPLQALGIIAGAGFVLGAGLALTKLGRSRREY